eukprot:GHVS01027581.1.p2 GENE.GHVS01027581.1~~GHVS01027581.1.p2  ORF type:complete len:105 (+),score=6.84 GHVS01027581.1:216-530(+)
MDRNRRHTIVLVQFSRSKDSRSYLDYDSLSLALDGICQMYEQGLKLSNPNLRNITYDVMDLFKYIDQLGDLAALYQEGAHSYSSHDKEWVKDQLFQHLKTQAQL